MVQICGVQGSTVLTKQMAGQIGLQVIVHQPLPWSFQLFGVENPDVMGYTNAIMPGLCTQGQIMTFR